MIDILTELEQDLALGRQVVLHGPVGIGKTHALHELAERARAHGRPVGLAPATRELGDITRALAAAYPETRHGAPRQRQLRGRLRLRVEDRPGVLVLDGLTAAGIAMRAFLRDLRGTGLGVVVAVDVDHPRDHARMRGFKLSAHERAMPRQGRRAQAALLAHALGGLELSDAERERVLDIADGRPGWILWMAERLRRPEYRRDGHLALSLVQADVAVDVSRRYLSEDDGGALS